jgi:hypothetical protein
MDLTKCATYSPSWINRLTVSIRRIPLSAWQKYPILFLLWTAIFGVLSRWIAGVLSLDDWTAYQIYDALSGPLLVWLVLAFMDYFEKEVLEAIDHAGHLGEFSAEDLESIRYRFINMPTRSTLLFSVLFFILPIPQALDEYGFSSITFSNLLVIVEWCFTSLIVLAFVFRMVRFMRQISKFFDHLTKLDLYNLSGIYELPFVAAKSGLFLMVLWYANLPINVNEDIINTPLYLLIAIIVSLIPIGAFIIPIGSLNRRLAREKKTALNSVSLQIKEAFQKVDHDLKNNRLDEMGAMQAAINNLTAKQKYLEAVPTWPWREGTFRITVTTVLLPIVVWLIQQILDRFLWL